VLTFKLVIHFLVFLPAFVQEQEKEVTQKHKKARGFGSPHQMNRHEESGKTKSSLDDSFDLRTYYMLKEQAFESAPFFSSFHISGGNDSRVLANESCTNDN
jgi:hypothetical protein